jgi:hypothetical protein
MSIKPASFEGALGAAEDACFEALCTILDLKAGQSAFVGANDGRLDCIVFDIGAIQTGDQMTYRANKFHYRGQCDLYNRDRRRLQSWIMAIVAALPVQRFGGCESFLRSDTNVIQFRVVPEATAVSGVRTTEIETGTNTKTIPVYTATVSFDIVFLAGDRTTPAAPSPDGNDDD